MSTPGRAPESSSSSLPPRSLNRQAILDEDEYTEALTKIIARDFFPSLVHLDATNTYLDALRTEDTSLINASVRRLQELATPTSRRGPQLLQTPSQTPWGAGPSDTPIRTPRDNAGRPVKRPRYDLDLNLDAFQARYTSEDNSSFTQILDDENRQRRQTWGWAWEAQKRVEAQRDKMLETRKKMLIEPEIAPGVREKFAIEIPQHAGLLTTVGGSEDQINAGLEIALSDEGKGVVERAAETQVVDVMARKKDTRPAGVDGWKFKTRNAFMFPPDADVAPYDAPPSSSNTVNRGPPKVIQHLNTRLPEQETRTATSSSEPPSPTRSRIDAAIAGTPYRLRSPTDIDLALLPVMPSPTPDELGPAAVKQLMTWGTLNATPRILSQSDDPAHLVTPNTPFHLPQPSARELISHRLSSTASKSLRARAALMGGTTPRTPGGVRPHKLAQSGAMGPPSWTPRRADAVVSLTPAARRLLDRTTTGVAGSRRAEAMGKAAGWEGSAKGKERDMNRVRWTPSPSPATRTRS